MQGFRKAAAGVALAAMIGTSATPALADGPGRWRHHYRHHDRGLNVGALIGGLAVVGAGAALIGAINRSDQRRHDDYYEDREPPPPPPPAYQDDYGWQPDPGFQPSDYAVRSEEEAVDACAVAAENQGREYARLSRVVDIVEVDRDARGWIVDGTIELRDGYRDVETAEERFRCAVTFQGLRDVRIAGYDYSAR